MNGLLDLTIIGFVFTPLAVTVLLLCYIVWSQGRKGRAASPMLDAPGVILAAALCWIPEERKAWGAAMATEMQQVRGWTMRWRFALGCSRAALFPPRRSRRFLIELKERSPVCGALAVALPPLGLPLIYFTTMIMEAIGGSPFTDSSRWSNADAAIAFAGVVVKMTLVCVLAGLPLGLAGWFRRERLRWLSTLGMVSSVCILGYFLIVMNLIATGPNGD
jgi:hypothetical protein